MDTDYYFKRINARNMKVLHKNDNKNIRVTFEYLEIVDINVNSDKKYIIFKGDMSNEHIVEIYRNIEELETKLESFVGYNKKTYFKYVIDGVKIKCKMMYRYNHIEVNSDISMHDLKSGMILSNVVFELSNVYIIDKEKYLISGGIWVIKSFQ